ncbi:tyrosine-type recombinase/integrase [Trueperella bialowiezensis]|uniref:Site-specific tyrosine recombinase XerC n=1 Tax=Trueperella bialowiezensis TaxID=312285 RepID=A0A448PE70_9ACTO|nr:tyrosine-type recombinase/integrase [Trueperella bialowiezensis]VEI13200.1 site-specific tyrosine recombinase XerC [Trueperella bialowiezensis]
MARALFGSIRRTKSGNYIGRYRVGGKDYYTATMRTKTEVRDLLAQIRTEMIQGQWTPPLRKTRHTPTFATWADEWITAQEKAGLSVNTIRAYTSLLAVHITPIVGDLKLDEITTEHAEIVHATALGKVAPITARNVLLCFSSCMNAAVDARLVTENPVKVKGGLKRHRPIRPKIALDADQVDDLITATPGQWRLGILLMSYGCLRYGECAAVKVDDLDVERLTVRVDESVKRDKNGGLCLGVPKSEAAYRTNALPARHGQIVEEHLRLFAEPNPLDVVFWHEGLTSNRRWNGIIRDAAAAAKLPSELRCHDLRHTGLTLYGRAGATLADLMERAGHADADTVMVYQHSSAQRDRELIDRV